MNIPPGTPIVELGKADEILHALSQLAHEPHNRFKVIVAGGRYQLAAPTFWDWPIIRTIVRLYRWIRGFSHADRHDFTHLKSFFERLLVTVNPLPPEEKQRYQAAVDSAFESLKSLYDYNRRCHGNTVVRKIERNDILEALSTACRKEHSFNSVLGTNVRRIPAPRLNSEPFRPGEIPLIPYDKLEKAISRFNAQQGPLTLEQLRVALKTCLVKEKVPLGKWIERFYGHPLLPLEPLNRMVTRRMKPTSSPGTIQSICRFLNRLKIPVESVKEKEVYAYSEMFGKTLREVAEEEASENKVFCRQLVDMSELDKRLTEVVAKIPRPIITGAFCRLTYHFIQGVNEHRGVEEGRGRGVDERINITGKLFSDSAANRHAAHVERAFGTYAFSIREMLTMPESAAKPKEAALLQILADAFHNHPAGLHMFIKRLDPGALHCFEAPVTGRILSRTESCAVLQALLIQQGNTNRAEQLNKLHAYFSNEENQDEIIHIPGTCASVNTALTQNSRVLATNSRKIVLIQDEDGELSLHGLVGATSVDDLQVPGGAGNSVEMGGPFGYFGLGPQQPPKKTNKMPVQPGEIRVLTAGSVQASQKMGQFGLGGSMIISIHLGGTIEVNPLLTQPVRYRKVEQIGWGTRFFNLFRRFFRQQPIMSSAIDRVVEIQCGPRDWKAKRIRPATRPVGSIVPSAFGPPPIGKE